MATIDQAIRNSGVTPARRTHVTWDTTESLPTEPPWSRHVETDQFRAQHRLAVIRMSSGAFILEPLNWDFGLQHETTDGQQYTIRLSEWHADASIVEVPMQRVMSELSGVSPDAGVAASGDYYMTRRIAAGATWAPSLVSSATKVTYDTQNYPMDRVLEGPLSGKETPLQGYILKFFVPGGVLQTPDNVLTFYFGGPVDPAHGYGQFGVAFTGDGHVKVAEFIDGAWVVKNTWRYARPQDVAGQMHAMTIIPHVPNFIEFSPFSEAPYPNQFNLLTEGAAAKVHAADTESPQSWLFQANDRGRLTMPSGATLPPTGDGSLALDVRRDLRMFWQVQRIAYPASGQVVEYPFMVPYQLGDAHVLQVSALAFTPQLAAGVALTDATASLANPDTNITLPTANETYTLNGTSYTVAGFVPPGDVNKCQLVLTLRSLESAPRYHSPAFYSYDVRRNSNVETVIGEELTGGTLTKATFSGPDTHPDHETGRLWISDLSNELPTLITRGKIPVRVETQYDAADDSKTAILFEGYAGRIEARKRHGTGTDYPSADWHDLTCELVGKWERLQDRFFHDILDFTDDATAPGGQSRPGIRTAWKVTDAIRVILWRLGFQDDQLDIFDDPIRFFVTPSGSTRALITPRPGMAYTDWLAALARDYLNAFIVWDANAGDAGMWRLRRPPTTTTPAIWNFVTTPQNPGKLPHQSASYGANTSPVLGPWPFNTYVVAPEANLLIVNGAAPPLPDGKPGRRLTASFVNRKSFNAPGYTAADKTDLDYLPWVKEIEYNDPSIDSQDALCFVGRRVFNLVCRGRQFARFTSELVLVAPADTLARGGGPVYTTHARRPLMIGDVVNMDGVGYMVRSHSPFWHKDHIQLADTELELLRRDLTYG